MLNPSWRAVRLIAHRCGGSLAPENSLAGLDAAARLGIHAVEFDAMLSADGVPMLIHDDRLERTTNGHGAVAEHTAEALQGMSVAKGWNGRFADQFIPTLADTLLRCQALGLLPNIEIKPSLGCDEATGEAVARCVQDVWQGGSGALPLLSSFSEPALAAACRLLPGWPSALLVEVVPVDWRDRLSRLGAGSLHCEAGQSDWSWLAEARAMGIAVRCYTVNSQAQASALWGKGVTAIFSDKIDQLRDLGGQRSVDATRGGAS